LDASNLHDVIWTFDYEARGIIARLPVLMTTGQGTQLVRFPIAGSKVYGTSVDCYSNSTHDVTVSKTNLFAPSFLLASIATMVRDLG